MLGKLISLLTFLFINFSLVNNSHLADNAWIIKSGNVGKYYFEVCQTLTCIPKCCPDEEYLFGYDNECRPDKEMKKNFTEVPIFHKNLTKSGKFLSEFLLVSGRVSDPEFIGSDNTIFHKYYLTEEGILVEKIPNMYKRLFYLNATDYCVDYLLPIEDEGMREAEIRFLTRLRDLEVTDVSADGSFITYGLLVSCFFLALVFFVYALLPELRNLCGRILMAYVFSLFGAFLLLTILQLYECDADICKGLVYCTYFCFLASFCWMNVMACDIWWTFRGYAKARPIHRRGETFKFCMYCIYAWGLPAAMSIMVIVLNEIDMTHMPEFVTPNILLRNNFFGDDEKFLYLYIPMLILIVCNWIFYSMTAFNIWRLHRATAVLDSETTGTPASHRTQKYRFFMYLKLSLVMGISWIFEVFTYFFPNFEGWYISNVCNMLIGLNIFLIFVCKKRILRKLIKRFSECGKWKNLRPWFSRSQSSSTTAFDNSDEMCISANPNGVDKRNRSLSEI